MSTSYEEFLSAMEKAYEEKSGLSPKVATDIHLRFQVLAGELARLSSALKGAGQNLFPQSSSGSNLDLHGELRGLARKAATKAGGTLTFSRHTPAPQDLPLPKGTIVATASNPPLYFITTQEGVLATGLKEVQLSAQAQEEGQEGNVLPQQIKVLVTPPPGIGQVTNATPFSGGGEEEKDQVFRQRVVSCYKAPTNSANVGYYQALLEAHPLVGLAKVVPRHKGRGTVLLLYVPTAAKEEAVIQNQLMETLLQEREIGVDVTLKSAELVPISLTIQLQIQRGYELPHLEPLVSKVVTDYFFDLPIGEAFLLNHLGKLLLTVAGVENYHFSAPTTDVVPLPHQKIICHSPLIQREGA